MSWGIATRLMIALLPVLAAVPCEVVAQVSPTASQSWLFGGLGFGTFGGQGISGVAGLSHQRGRHLFALRATAVLGFASNEIDDSVADIGLLYGRASTGQGRVRHLSAVVGLSLVELSLRGASIQHTIGVPVAAEASVDTSVVGVGLKGFANLNPVHAYAGLVLVLKLGRLR